LSVAVDLARRFCSKTVGGGYGCDLNRFSLGWIFLATRHRNITHMEIIDYGTIRALII
jgi:hypothetical protein